MIYAITTLQACFNVSGVRNMCAMSIMTLSATSKGKELSCVLDVKERCEMKVLIGEDIDITNDIINPQSIEIVKQVSDYGQAIVTPAITLTLSDKDNRYNSRYGSGMFYNYPDYSEFKVSILGDSGSIGLSTMLYRGQIQEVNSDTGNQTTITINSELQKQLEPRFIYVSEAQMNPAEILRELCIQRGIEYDVNSINVSSNIYDNNAVVCSAKVLKPDTSILSFLQALAQIGIARIYTIDNKIAMNVYDKTAVPVPVITFDTSVHSGSNPLLSKVVYETIHKDPPQGYNVQWVGGVTEYTTESKFSDKFIQQISGGNDALVRIESLQSAVWIGETWHHFLNKESAVLTGDIAREYGVQIDLGYPIQISQDELSTTAEITQLTQRNSQRYSFQARTK